MSPGHIVPAQKRKNVFVARIVDARPKDDIASMEIPIFALRAGDHHIRTYSRNGITATVLPGATGCATIHDKDLWIYCASQLTEAANRGGEISPTVQFTAFDFLRATERGTCGRAYQRLATMLRRLSGTRIETNIETGGQRCLRGFGLIDSWRVVEKSPGDDRMVAIEVELSAWLYRSIQAKQVLTLNNEYFQIRRPIDRRLYEIARKHCGAQRRWVISLPVLHDKSGSASSLREFRRQVKELATNGTLPDYLVTFDSKRDMVTFYASGPKGKQAEAQDVLRGRPATSKQSRERAHAKAVRKRPQSSRGACG